MSKLKKLRGPGSNEKNSCTKHPHTNHINVDAWTSFFKIIKNMF